MSEKAEDLGKLSLLELKRLATQIETEIESRKEDGRRWLEQHGRGLIEREQAVYRNPKRASQTWSGRGARPAWIEEALAEGHTLESLAAAEPEAERNLPVMRLRTR